MIVDDTPSDIDALSGALKERGYKVRFISEAKLAFQSVQNDPPDLILLDTVMPEMNGYEVCRILKENDKTKDIPVIFLTAMDKDIDGEMGLNAGAMDYILKKPVLIPVALARIYTHLQLSFHRNRLEGLVRERTAELAAANSELKAEIAERGRIEMDMRKVNKNLYMISKTASIGIWDIDVQTQKINWNDKMLDIFGISKADQSHMTVEQWFQKIYKEDQLLIRNLYNRIIERKSNEAMECRISRPDGSIRYLQFTVNVLLDDKKNITQFIGIAIDITDRKLREHDIIKAHSDLQQVLNSLSSIVIGVSVKDRITYWNHAAEKTFDFQSSEVLNKTLAETKINWEWNRIYEGISESITTDTSIRLDDLHYQREDGKDRILGIVVNPIKDLNGFLAGFIIQGSDITQRKIIEAQYAQSRKMESIGQLSAGIAHEINSPMQYINDNLYYLKNGMENINKILKKYDTIIEKLLNKEAVEPLIKDIKAVKESVNEADLLLEMPKAIDESIEGVGRVVKIIKSMKEFSHPDMGEKVDADINKAIERAADLSRNEWKYVADLFMDFEKDMPLVHCFLDELNQVILNIIVNAAQAIEEKNGKNSGVKGDISIATRLKPPYAEIRIGDTGNGIPEKIRSRIFDPFFTTKEVGKGTGQGLAIAHTVIVEKHGGELFFKTEEGKGTTFIIRIPLANQK